MKCHICGTDNNISECKHYNLNNTTMKNSTFTTAFLKSTDKEVKDLILSNVARHYGITKDQALEEITYKDAEHLLDYLTGPIRTAVSVLVQKFTLTFNN